MLNLSPQNRNQINSDGLVATEMLNKSPKRLLRNTIYALLIFGLIKLLLLGDNRLLMLDYENISVKVGNNFLPLLGQ